jgi:hypothetical protein
VSAGLERPSEPSVVIDNVRTTHYLLIGVCLALLVAATFEIRSDADRVLTEFRDLQQVIAAWAKNPAWLDDRLRRQFETHDRVRRVKTATSNLLLETDGQGWTLADLTPAQLSLFRKQSDGANAAAERVILPAPVTLAEFQRIWDQFETPVAVRFITAADTKADVSQEDSSIHFGNQITAQQSEQLEEAGEKAEVAAIVRLKFPRLDAERPRVVDGVRPAAAVYDLTGTAKAPLAEEDKLTDDHARYWVVRWRITTGKEDVSLQAAIDDQFGKVWRKGPFKSSFGDLQQFTANYQDLPLEKIDAILAGEAKRSAEKFDVVGVKIPLSSLKDWGSWILLGICGLLFIHLSAFAVELHAGKTAKMGSWIGLYPSPLSRATVLASFVALPLLTAAVLGARTLASWERGWWLACAALLALFVCGLACSLRLVRIWRVHAFL